MYFRSLHLLVGLATTALALNTAGAEAEAAKIGTTCDPTGFDPRICHLYYATNSGAVLDIAHPVTTFGKFSVYSPDCHTVLATRAWAVDTPGSAVLNPSEYPGFTLWTERKHGYNWDTPVWSYKKSTFAVSPNCMCDVGGQSDKGIHRCSCMFECDM